MFCLWVVGFTGFVWLWALYLSVVGFGVGILGLLELFLGEEVVSLGISC